MEFSIRATTPSHTLPSSTQVNSTRHHTGISVHHQEKSWGSVSGRALVGELGKSRSLGSIFKFRNRDPASPRARRSKRPEVDRDARGRIPFVRILTYVHTYQCVHTTGTSCVSCVCMHQHRSEHAQRSDISIPGTCSQSLRLFLFNCICHTFDPLDSPLPRPGFYVSHTCSSGISSILLPPLFSPVIHLLVLHLFNLEIQDTTPNERLTRRARPAASLVVHYHHATVAGQQDLSHVNSGHFPIVGSRYFNSMECLCLRQAIFSSTIVSCRRCCYYKH